MNYPSIKYQRLNSSDDEFENTQGKVRTTGEIPRSQALSKTPSVQRTAEKLSPSASREKESNQNVPKPSIMMLRMMIKIRSLDDLSLRSTSLEEVKCVLNCLGHNRKLKNLSINLSTRHLTPKDLSYLLTYPLLELKLYGDSIGDDGAIIVANKLKTNETLQILSLNSNKITDKGSKALSEMLKVNKTLKTLKLRWNKISDKGLDLIIEAINNGSPLEYLDVGSNPISNSGRTKLRNLIKESNKLREIDITDEDGYYETLKK